MIIVLWKTRVKHFQRFLTSLTFCRFQLCCWRLHENRSRAQISFFSFRRYSFYFAAWIITDVQYISLLLVDIFTEVNLRTIACWRGSMQASDTTLLWKFLSLSSGRTVSGDSILRKISLFSCDLKENANNCFRLRTSNLFFVPISVDYKLTRAEMKTTRRR